jgi:NAD+ synthase
VDKAPSADLWPGQTDESELGYTYDDADQLLYLLVDRRYKPEEAVSAGFNEVFVDKLWKRVQQMHYKRHLPVIAKLSRRTMGYDFLYMRDWGT